MSWRRALGAYQVGVELVVGAGEELFGDAPDDLAVGVDEVERLGRGCVFLVQCTDVLGGRQDHRGSVAIPRHGETRSCSQMITRAPSTFTFERAAWRVDPDRLMDLDSPYCGHTRLCIGRLAFDDAAYRERVRLVAARVEFGA
ncbi:hypothetical protein GCM10020000_06900 [Streptomyces olivoverticillatus]